MCHSATIEIARNKDEVIALVQRALAAAAPLIDYGVAHGGLGHPPPDEGIRFAQQAEESNGGILEHYERDLTVRAAAGVTMGALNARLKPTNQFVPIDADDDLTLGEIIMHNVYGPLRVSFGSVRDLLLGMHYIDGEGRDIHVGGRTVKNVAGYDVTRFMVGSLGELGVVHEATLRTYAIPQHVLAVDLDIVSPGELCKRFTELLLSDASPAHLSISRRLETVAGRHGGQWVGHLAYFGRSAGGHVQLRSLETLLDGFESVHIAGSGDQTFEQDAAERAARRAWRRQATALVKIVVPPAHTGVLCATLAEWADTNAPLHIDALPMHGCVFTGGALDAGAARQLDDTIHAIMGTLRAFRVWHQRPDGAESIEPFAPSQNSWAILRRLKQTMDPKGVFNPRRFLVD